MIGSWKLNEEDVKVIKDLLKLGMTHQSIGDMFGVSREHITAIKQGRRWNTDNHSFTMKKSNDYRQFTDVQERLDDYVFEVDEPRKVETILIKYSDGTKDLFKSVNG